MEKKDYTSYFLLQNKAYRITIPATSAIAFALLLACELIAPEHSAQAAGWGGFIKNCAEIIIVMALTSLSGYVVGAMSVFALFAILSLRHGFVYQPVMLMVASLLANLPVMRLWYTSLWKTVLACLLFVVVLGSGASLLILFLMDVRLSALAAWLGMGTAQNIALFTLLFAIPCVIVCALGYTYFNIVPQQIRSLFFTNSYTYASVQRLRTQISKRKGASVSAQIFRSIIVTAIILMVSAFGFSSGLLEEVFGEQSSLDMTRYITRIFFLMMMVAVPTVLAILTRTNVTISNPLILMAKAVQDSAQSTDEGGTGIDIRSLSLANKDEIGVLYDALIKAQDSITAYMEKQDRERHLEAELEVAKQASLAKTTFLSNMSHEIRTPINAVLGLDEMIIRESTERDIVNYAMDIQGAGKSLLSIINDILDFSKIEAGKMEIIPVEYDLSSVVNDLVNMIAKRAEDKGLELHIDVDERIPHLLYGDEIRVKQCALNILTNAVKYTEKGSVTLSVSYAKAADDRVALTVHVVDTGIGIKDNDISKLYTAFQRIEEKRNRTIEGTGLGMNITQQLLGLMGSRLEVRSKYGHGSDFFFTVEQKVIKWEPIGNFVDTYKKAQSQAQAYHEGFHAPEARVLVVDDTRLNLTVIRGLLKQTQIQVDTAESGAATLSMVTQKKYDILFIDHRMPVMDGIETLHAMQTLDGNLNRGVPCVALTANAISGAREMYLAAGFTDYLTKPVDSKKLERMLLDYLPPEKVEPAGADGGTDAAGPGGAGEAAGGEAGALAGHPELAALRGVDVAAAVQNCGGADVLADVLRDFYAAIDEKSALIEQYAAAQDFKNYTVLVHALKSSARLIGAMQLSQDAAFLEQCGDKGNAAEIAARTAPLIALYRDYKEHLAPLAAPSASGSLPPMPPEEFMAALASLRECIQAFDFDTADAIIQQIEQYAVPDAEAERYRAIKAKVAAVDHAALLALL